MLCVLLCLPFQLLMGDLLDVNEGKFSVGPVPAWVAYCAVPQDVKTPEDTNLQFLLMDSQSHWEEKTRYFHYAIKALNQSGVSSLAQVDIDFDPTYEQVIVHNIRVYRDGKSYDRLKSARYNLLQRESELELDLYHGELTLVYFLADIQEGDVVEYDYSILGVIDYFASHCTLDFPLQNIVPMERIFHRLLIHPDRLVQYKSFNTEIQPQITQLSKNLNEWRFEIVDPEPYFYEDNQPDWYEPFAHVQLSEYQSWDEVIQKIYPMYIVSNEGEDPEEMTALIQSWINRTSDPQERAFLALRFVQEKVRYLGFEEGLNGFKPTDPRIVFQRRFGDCKDKVFLLSTLLKRMNIDSTAVLVSVEEGFALTESLPLPFAFDHVILRIDIDGTAYWVDPTINCQGGRNLQENFFPNYTYGLPLAEHETELVDMPSIRNEQPTLIDTSFVLKSAELADLKITWTFYGEKADGARGYLRSRGVKNMTDESLKGIQKLYGKGTLLAPIAITDDPLNNVLSFTESYRIPTHNRSGKKMLKVYSFVIKNYLESGLNPERVTPYALYYPAWVQERIHIENPFMVWSDDSEEMSYEHSSLYFANSSERGGHTADYYYELKHLKDHVSVDDIYDYWEMTNEIEESGLNLILVSKP